MQGGWAPRACHACSRVRAFKKAPRKEKSGKRESQFHEVEKSDLVDIICNKETTYADGVNLSTMRNVPLSTGKLVIKSPSFQFLQHAGQNSLKQTFRQICRSIVLDKLSCIRALLEGTSCCNNDIVSVVLTTKNGMWRKEGQKEWFLYPVLYGQ